MRMVEFADQEITIMFERIDMRHNRLLSPWLVPLFRWVHPFQLFPCLLGGFLMARMIGGMRQPEIERRISVKTAFLKAFQPTVRFFIFSDQCKSRTQFIAVLKDIWLDLFQQAEDIFQFIV